MITESDTNTAVDLTVKEKEKLDPKKGNFRLKSSFPKIILFFPAVTTRHQVMEAITPVKAFTHLRIFRRATATDTALTYRLNTILNTAEAENTKGDRRRRFSKN